MRLVTYVCDRCKRPLDIETIRLMNGSDRDVVYSSTPNEITVDTLFEHLCEECADEIDGVVIAHRLALLNEGVRRNRKDFLSVLIAEGKRLSKEYRIFENTDRGEKK